MLSDALGRVPTGGELKYSYVVQTGGGISTSGTGKATIVDTKMAKVSGDFIVMSGGSLDMSYSQVGLDENATGDTTHCDMHFGGMGNTIKVTRLIGPEDNAFNGQWTFTLEADETLLLAISGLNDDTTLPGLYTLSARAATNEASNSE